jgi:hypothetical protein
VKSGIGEEASPPSPDCASLHPGYVQTVIVTAAGPTAGVI